MTFEESQDYIAKRGFDIPWNDCDVFVDEREINRTVGNVLKWADENPKEGMISIESACEWLDNIDFEMEYHYSDDGYTFFNKEKFINDFRKAMEE